MIAIAVFQYFFLMNGYGYHLWIRNFDRLRESLGVKDDENALNYFEEVCRTTDRKEYQKAVADYLEKNATKKVKRSSINKALAATNEDPRSYDALLRGLALISEH